jgi:Family of unknown function (DUF6600)/FecR protein
MNTRDTLDRTVLGTGLLVLLAGSLAWAQEYSHARIVRLSFVEGTVTMLRPSSPEWAEASVNTPLEEGFKLATAQDSFAEVEFENTSTARVGQFSELDFNQLALAPSGGKVNHLELRQGYATFDFIPEDDDDYQVTAGTATVTLGKEKPTRFRVDLEGDNVRVEVFKGGVEVASPFGTERVAKNDVFEMRPGADQPTSVTRGITKDAWDEWVDVRAEQAQTARRRSPVGLYTNNASDLLYGWNDLYYYGNWAYVPGYGYGWSPYVSAGWSPYSYGQWAWYPGFGYTWISNEPWGWVPFHYGGWVFQPGLGWCWIPGEFGFWSPGLVNWYQGPGWVGWTPQAPRPPRGSAPGWSSGSACPQGQGCTTAVSADAFRDGLPVRGHRIPMADIPQSFAVNNPSIRPRELGSVTGSAFAGGTARRVPAGGDAMGAARRGAASGVAAPSRARTPSAYTPASGFGNAGAASRGQVVFDPAEGRYVNGHTAAPAAPATGPAETPSTAAGNAGAPAPAIVAGETHPQPSGAGPQSSPRAFEADHHASPRSGIEMQQSSGVSQRLLQSWGAASSGRQSSGMDTSHGRSSTFGGRSEGSWTPARSSAGSSGGARSSGASSAGSFGTAAPRSGGASGGAARSSSGSGHPH